MKLLELKNKIVAATSDEVRAVQSGAVLPAESEARGYSRRRALVTFGGGLGVVGAAILTGCGSGGNGGSVIPSGSVSGSTGRATMTIVWPAQDATATTKLIPVATNSIQVSILNGTTVVGNQVVARPSSGNSSTVTFDTLPVGTLTVQAQAHPNADGTGTDQASAQTSITITANAVTPLTLTMASTIDHVTLISYDSSISVGTSTSLQLTAYDSTGATVLITSSSVTFTSLTPSIATVSSIGAATGVAAGTASFRAIETESGQAATVSVTVMAAATPTPTPSASPSAGSCTLVPSDEIGPFPLSTYLNNSTVNRSNVVETQTGVPLTLNLTFVNVNGSCAPLTNAAIYIWHCNKSGEYSGYSSNQNGNHAGETYLRGLQVTNSSGAVTFTTIYPGWYAGRITHIHFEVFLNATYSSTASAKVISQLCFPQSVTQAVYASSLYASHGQNTSVSSIAADHVFSDGATYQMLATTGSVSAGYTASLVIGVAG